jgi:hypothetical protein
MVEGTGEAREVGCQFLLVCSWFTWSFCRQFDVGSTFGGLWLVFDMSFSSARQCVLEMSWEHQR